MYKDLINPRQMKNLNNGMTWWNVNPCVLLLCDVHEDGDPALNQPQLHPSISQLGEHKQTTGVPRPERQTHWQRVAVTLTRQPQEGRGVKEDREGVGLRTGECQVTLKWNTERDSRINASEMDKRGQNKSCWVDFFTFPWFRKWVPTL